MFRKSSRRFWFHRAQQAGRLVALSPFLSEVSAWLFKDYSLAAHLFSQCFIIPLHFSHNMTTKVMYSYCRKFGKCSETQRIEGKLLAILPPRGI